MNNEEIFDLFALLCWRCEKEAIMQCCLNCDLRKKILPANMYGGDFFQPDRGRNRDYRNDID